MNFEPLARYLNEITKEKIPGADIIVLKDHKTVFRYQAGYADREAKIPMRGDELYNLYSASKMLTCTAALQLMEQGCYLMTDPISEFLPAFKQMYILQEDGSLLPAKTPIRVRELFTMTAGLDYNLDTPAIRAARARGNATTAEIVDAIAAGPLHFEPGTHWNYSLCHDVLGRLIEVWSGQRFGDYLQQHVLEPIGMKETGFARTPDRVARLAAQYEMYAGDIVERVPSEIHATGKNLAVSYSFSPDYESGGAGLISSVADMALYMDTMAHLGRASNGERILSEATVNLMRTNHLTEEMRLHDYNWAGHEGYGYGLGVRTLVDRTAGGNLSSIGEFGWAGAAGAFELADPSIGLAVYYAEHMRNSREPEIHPRLRNLIYSGLDY